MAPSNSSLSCVTNTLPLFVNCLLYSNAFIPTYHQSSFGKLGISNPGLDKCYKAKSTVTITRSYDLKKKGLVITEYIKKQCSSCDRMEYSQKSLQQY